MPQNKFAIARYRLIDETLRKKTYVKTIEIVNICAERLGFKVTQRTIQMDIEALKYDSFLGCFLPICYDQQRKAYYYSEKPTGFLFTIYMSDTEISVLKNIKQLITEQLSDSDYQLYCSILNKIEQYTKPTK